MNRFRSWLGVPSPTNQRELIETVQDHSRKLHLLGKALERMDKLERELTELRLEFYRPPQQIEAPKKVIRAQTFKQFTDMVEQEFEEREARDAN